MLIEVMVSRSALEAWPFYRTISCVRLCWVLEEPKGPKGADTVSEWVHAYIAAVLVYGGTSLIRKRTLLGPYRSLCLGSCGGPRGVGVFL